MLKKILCFVFSFLIIFSLAWSWQKFPYIPKKSIISMDIRDYRDYLKNNSPLDRLYCSGDTCFFLVENSYLPEMKKTGFPFQERGSAAPAFNLPLDSGNGDYHSYLETEAALYDLEARYPHLSRVFSIGQSIEGRELYVIKISDNVTINETEPNIFISGCHHAREWISIEVPLLFARYLLEHYADNPQVKKAVEGSQVFILPVVNPDGLEFSMRYYRMWRKNRRYNGDLIWGVDINRNYGFAWGYDDTGSSPYPYSDTYRGEYPFSEPETSAVKNFLLENPPAAAINFHNFSQKILYSWGYTEEPAADDAEMGEIAKKMSESIFRVNGRTYTYGPGATAIYPTNGDSDDWIYGTFGAFSYTIELPPLSLLNGGFITGQEEIDLTFAENLPALLYFVNYFVPGNGENPVEKSHQGKTRPAPVRTQK